MRVFFLFKIILAPSNSTNQGSFAHGQVISFGDGQQAIIVQNPDQSGGHQSLFSLAFCCWCSKFGIIFGYFIIVIQLPANMTMASSPISIQTNSNGVNSQGQAISLPGNGLGNVIMVNEI